MRARVHLKSVGDVTAHLECHGYTLAGSEDSRRARQSALIICLAVSVMTARPTPRPELWLARRKNKKKHLIGALIRDRDAEALGSLFLDLFFLRFCEREEEGVRPGRLGERAFCRRRHRWNSLQSGPDLTSSV